MPKGKRRIATCSPREGGLILPEAPTSLHSVRAILLGHVDGIFIPFDVDLHKKTMVLFVKFVVGLGKSHPILAGLN
jgi:hypothetical protein